MRIVEALASAPAGVLLCGVVCVVTGQWLSYLADVHREKAHTRRVELAVRGTKSRDREAVVRACGEGRLRR